jgi:hypothetical protein
VDFHQRILAFKQRLRPVSVYFTEFDAFLSGSFSGSDYYDEPKQAGGKRPGMRQKRLHD